MKAIGNGLKQRIVKLLFTHICNDDIAEWVFIIILIWFICFALGLDSVHPMH